MIRICAIKTEDLSSVALSADRLSFDVGAAKRESLSRARDKTAAASLAGLFLLQKMALDVGISLADRTLAYEAGGRPYFPDAPIDFSITHTEGLVACALSVGKSPPPHRVGLDAEALGSRTPQSMERISARFFCDSERALFLSSPDESTFLEIWTGKEALCKQDGIGLSGISRYDALAPAPSRLTRYRLPGFVLTLAAPQGAAPPSGVEVVGVRSWALPTPT